MSCQTFNTQASETQASETQASGIRAPGTAARTPEKCWYVYMILTDQHSLYTGIATDPIRRFQEHLDTAQGKHKARGAKFFRRATPLKIVFTEKFDNRSQASQREAQIKALNASEKQLLVKNS